MNAKRVLAILCLAFILLAGCSGENQNVASSGYSKISADEAKDMMEGEDVIVLDVRPLEDYQREHIPDAISLPNDGVETGANKLLPDKNAIILVYCKSGKNSAAAAEKLVKMGYANVYDFGGINEWPYGTVRRHGDVSRVFPKARNKTIEPSPCFLVSPSSLPALTAQEHIFQEQNI